MSISKYQLYNSEYIYIHLNAYEQGIQLDSRKNVAVDHIIITSEFTYDDVIFFHMKRSWCNYNQLLIYEYLWETYEFHIPIIMGGSVTRWTLEQTQINNILEK